MFTLFMKGYNTPSLICALFSRWSALDPEFLTPVIGLNLYVHPMIYHELRHRHRDMCYGQI